ncbi:MAG: hypothetical protein Q8K75_03190 [Chlamydiales bacterium]|nr:hypothetical protein [Chlamydiales bacterium]
MTVEQIPDLVAKRKKRKFLGLRFSAIVETLALLAVLIAGDYYWGAGERFMNISPHPFWAIVLLIAVQYGTVEGIAAAFLCSLALYVGNMPPQVYNETLFDYQLHIAKVPFLWFVAAFILGEMRLRVEGQKIQLADRLDELTEQATVVFNAYQKLKATKEHQDRLLASQRKTVASIYKTFHYLQAVSPSQILLDLDKIFYLALSPKKFSVFALGQNGFEIATSHGWNESDIYQRRISTETPLYQAVGVQRRLVVAIDPKDEEILQGQGVLAGPLFDPEKKQLLGMVKVEEVDFLELNVNTLEAFQALCEIVGIAYAHARRFRALERNTLFSETEGVYSMAFFKEQRRYLQILMQATSQPLSAISIEAGVEAEFAHEEALARLIEPLIAPGQLFKGGRRNTQLAVLMPQTSKEAATELAFQIISAVEQNEYLRSLKITQRVEAIVEPAVIVAKKN